MHLCIEFCCVQETCVVSEKKIGKSLQYDLPGDLVMAYLADVSIDQIMYMYNVMHVIMLHRQSMLSLILHHQGVTLHYYC